jgi:hypothetical protein
MRNAALPSLWVAVTALACGSEPVSSLDATLSMNDAGPSTPTEWKCGTDTWRDSGDCEALELGAWQFVGGCGFSIPPPRLLTGCPAATVAESEARVEGHLELGEHEFSITATRAAMVHARIPGSCLGTLGGCTGYERLLVENGVEARCVISEPCECDIPYRYRDNRAGTFDLSDGLLTLRSSDGATESLTSCAHRPQIELRSTSSSAIYLLER